MKPTCEFGPVREVVTGRRGYFGFLAAACAAVGALCVYCGATLSAERLLAVFFYLAAAALFLCVPVTLRLAAARVTLYESGWSVRIFSERRFPLSELEALDWRSFGRKGGCLYLCLKGRPAVPVLNAIFPPAALYDRLHARAEEAGIPQKEPDDGSEDGSAA